MQPGVDVGRDTMATFRDMEDVKTANRTLGHHWFDADTMRFFHTRLCGGLIAGRYFVSSEKGRHQTTRRYTVREVRENGAINTVGEFQGYASAAIAKAVVLRLVAGESRVAA